MGAIGIIGNLKNNPDEGQGFDIYTQVKDAVAGTIANTPEARRKFLTMLKNDSNFGAMALLMEMFYEQSIVIDSLNTTLALCLTELQEINTNTAP